MSRAMVHYSVAFLILLIYGGQVCPFVENLDLSVWGMVLAADLGAVLLARRPALARLVEAAPEDERAGRQFWLDMAAFQAAGGLVIVFDLLFFD